MSYSPIQSGQEISVQSMSGGAAPLQLRCGQIEQRNWSRVSVAEAIGNGKSFFVKQYLDKAGTGHPDHWAFEKDGALLAAPALSGIAHVPALLHRDEALLLNVFEYQRMVSLDVLLRNDAAGFERCFPAALRRMAQTLAVLREQGKKLQGSGIPVKNRDYGGPSDTLNFKGFEIRNAGVPPEAPGELNAADLVLFDFVRPYLAPAEEAAAKLFVSIGLLNWGSPVSRFMKGPDTGLLASSYSLLAPLLDSDAVSAELALQERFRMAELKTGGDIEKLLKRTGMHVLGRKYLAALRDWCSDNVGRNSQAAANPTD